MNKPEIDEDMEIRVKLFTKIKTAINLTMGNFKYTDGTSPMYIGSEAYTVKMHHNDFVNNRFMRISIVNSMMESGVITKDDTVHVVFGVIKYNNVKTQLFSTLYRELTSIDSSVCVSELLPEIPDVTNTIDNILKNVNKYHKLHCDGIVAACGEINKDTHKRIVDKGVNKELVLLYISNDYSYYDDNDNAIWR